MERAGPAAAPGPLPRWALARVFLRSLLLQASWNRRGMQNLGFAYALWPALVHLYPDASSRSRAAARHLAFFNSHPYLASAIVGGALFHEERVARGEEEVEAVERFKSALMFPFAAVGDSFFWLSLRPLAGMAAALLAPWIGLWSVGLFLALYNVPHLAFRIALFVDGYRRGDRVVERVARAGLPKWGARLRRASAVGGGAAGVVAVWHVARAGLNGGDGAWRVAFAGLHGGDGAWLLVAAAAGFAVFLGTWALLARRGSLWAALASIGIGIALALAGAGS